MMSNKIQSGVVPDLRFTEFDAEQSWESCRLGEVADLKNGYAFKSKEYDETGQFRIVTIGNVQDGRLDLSATNRISTLPKDIQTHHILEEGDLLLSMTGNVGRVCLVDQTGLLLNQRVGKIEATEIDHSFLFQLLCRKTFASAMQLAAAGGAQGNISSKSILGHKIFRPTSDAEQQKIAACLGSLDALIAAEGRKLEAFRAHRKGLMQQLFPRGGKARPRLRFPEFSDRWIEKPLKTIANYQNGKAYEKYIEEDGKYIVVNSRFISTDGLVRKFTNEQFCTASKGDVLMVLSDLPNGRALAKAFLVDRDECYAVNQRVCRLMPTDVRSDFLAFLINRHRNLMRFDDGVTQTHLSKSDVEDCVLWIPPTEQEQNQVADCLSSLTNLELMQSSRIEFLAAHRRGLMQQLFPSLKDVVS